MNDEMGRACCKHDTNKNAQKILIGKPEWKGSLRRPKYRCEDNIKTDVKKIRYEGVN
jgi:hypothetical protein